LLRFQIGFVWRFLGRRHVVREALPDAIALSRLACRVRIFVGQDSILVVRRIINDTIGIVSHDRTGASLCHQLAALPFIAATRLHLALLIPHFSSPPATWSSPSAAWSSPSAIWHSSFAICHSSSAIWHLPSGICHPPFLLPHSAFRIPHSAQRFQSSHQLAVPGGLVAALPLECRAAIQRRAVVPLVSLVGRDFLMLGQQPLKPSNVPLDDRADEDQRRSLIAGREKGSGRGKGSSLISTV